MDDHPAEGFYAFDRKPCRQAKIPGPYNIPYRRICSKNIGNLMMAGRNISCSHVAFTSTRVMHVRIFGPGSWNGGCNMFKRGGVRQNSSAKIKNLSIAYSRISCATDWPYSTLKTTMKTTLPAMQK